MRDDPGFDLRAIRAALVAAYGLSVESIAFLPIGQGPGAAVYELRSTDGASWFLKAHRGPIYESGLVVPTALGEAGIVSVVAPVRTLSGALSVPLDEGRGATLVLFPFIRGDTAQTVGMSNGQWREFGATLRAVHDSGLAAQFQGVLEVESFALPSASKVRRLLTQVQEQVFEGPVAARLAAFWRRHAHAIGALLERAETLGSELREKRFDLVLCHADIHTANVLVGTDGRVHLVDWDGPPRPMIAPRERDLVFIIGSRIGRPVLPAEEAWFFEGYGDVTIDPVAIAYYRYERIVEDIGEFTESVFFNAHLSDEARAAEVDLAVRFLEPGGAIDTAESVASPRRAHV